MKQVKPYRIAIRHLASATLALALASQSAQANEPMTQGYIETFGDTSFLKDWWFSNYESGGAHSATHWRPRMASVVIPVVNSRFPGGALALRLAPAGGSSDRPFLGAEAQRGGAHHYGDYETIMQAGRGSGVVSAFFTYTGPYFGNPHDEIDFEILGKDTTSVWINRFVDGEQMPGKLLPLGFDSADAPHLYRFSWREDYISWSVDEREIYRITADEMPIPSHPGKLFLSIWAGNPNQIAWLGEIAPETRTSAQFFCVSFRPVGDTGETCSDHFPPPY